MRLLFFICLLMLSNSTWGQHPVVPGTNEILSKRHQDRPVNFGVKGGFTSSLFLVSNFSINGIEVKDVQNNYKIGYFASVFMRINFEYHFLQPEVSYNINRCNITFDKPTEDAAPPPETASITSSIHSIDIPVIYGYNVIKDGPYSLAVFGGPKLRFIWNNRSEVRFENFDQTNIHESLRPLNVSFTLGVDVTIGRVFFDFRYDIGLHNISKRVTYNAPVSNDPVTPAIANSAVDVAPNNEIRFYRRDNVLSFSLGIFF